MTLKTILNKLIKKKRHPKTLKKILKSVGFSKQIIDSFKQEDKLSADALKKISTEIAENKLEENIRDFLKKRWALIHRTDLTYTSFPHYPLNQICVELAKALVKPGESLVQILMPTLRVQDYDIIAETLQTLTQTDQEINFCNFLVSESGAAVLPLKAWFEAQLNNKDQFLNHLYSHNSELVALSSREIQYLRHCTMPASDCFFEEFKLRTDLMSAKGTLAEATLRFCDGLRENGQGGKGTGAQAHDDVFACIREYGQILMKLPEETRSKLFILRDSEDTPFSYYWNILSGNDWGNRGEDPQTCVEVNSEGIKHILIENPDEFAAIKLQDQSDEKHNQTTPFSNLLDSINSIISHRATLLRPQFFQGAEGALKIYHPQGNQLLKNKNLIYAEALNQPLSNPVDSLAKLDYYQSFLSAQALDEALEKLNQEKITEIFAESAVSEDTFFAEFLLSKPFFNPSIYQLFQAVSLNKIDIVRAWVNHKREFNQRIFWTTDVDEPYSPLSYALHQGHLEISLILIQAGADLSEKYGDLHLPLLIWAIEEKLDEVVNCLILRGIDVNTQDQQGLTALHLAVQNGKTSWVQLLLEHHADINVKNFQGNTPLHEAVNHNHFPIIRLLHQHRADLNMTNKYGNTPLHLCTGSANLECLNFLIQNHANLNIVNKLNQTPLMRAYAYNKFSLVISLITAGAEFSYDVLLESAITNRQYNVLSACIDQEPNLLNMSMARLNRILMHFLVHTIYPKRMQAYINRLVLAGATISNLIDHYRHKHLEIPFNELMKHPDLDKFKVRYGFEGICQLANIKPASLDGLKLYAGSVEKHLFRRNPEAAEKISQALQTGGLNELCKAIEESRASSSVFSYFLPSIDLWSDLPEGLQNVVRANVRGNSVSLS